jgi:hypothetical protein
MQRDFLLFIFIFVYNIIMNLALHLPINSTSFGQVSVGLLREIYSRGIQPRLFLIGDPDFSTHNVTEEFKGWIGESLRKGLMEHDRKSPAFKLWHLNDLSSVSDHQILLTFHELDQLTPAELNVIKNNFRVLVSSKYSKSVFEKYDVKNVEYLPLFFDSFNFHRKEKKYFNDGRITFNLLGKAEARKRHVQIIRAWVAKYGNNPQYQLQCAIYNNFLSPEDNQKFAQFATDGKKYFNVSFSPFMTQTSLFNDFLNSGDIVIGGSGGEGFGLGEMHSVALGRHSVILNSHSYQSWANDENSVLFEPNGKSPCYDSVFFHPNSPYNQGNLFTWSDADMINACEKAITRVKINRTNIAGLRLQEEFSVKKTVDQILSYF